MKVESQVIPTEPEFAGRTVTTKAPSVEIDLKSESDTNEDGRITDLFSSFPPIKGSIPEENPLTIRAILIGTCLGSLVNASNVYLGI
jgi:hypothetical protein